MFFNTRRRRLYILIFILSIGFYASLWNKKLRRNLPEQFRGLDSEEERISIDESVDHIVWTGGSLPGPGPSYERFRKAERALPQHNLNLPYPEGKSGKYVKFATQIEALGWNNVLNEVLLCAHLAWRTKRAYVFQDYVWKPEYYPWRIREYPWPRNPLTTLISGPVAGGPWEDGDDTPRSISAEWFDVVCPKEERFLIDSDSVKEGVRWSTGSVILEAWVKVLSETSARCVEVVPTDRKKDSYPQVFDLWMIGDGRSLTIWPEFKVSPISRLLGPSPLVQSAIKVNEHLFYRSLHFSNYKPYEHMMAVHIRRGDFQEACASLANWNSTFYGWNLLEELPDPFRNPTIPYEMGKAPKDVRERYNERCLPTNEYILKKIADSKRVWEAENGGKDGNGRKRSLNVLFVMTNAKDEWIREFKDSLKREGAGWSKVVTTRDLEFDEEQRGVNMVVDMELARRSAVYIGNGWSSMTSNILHMRLVDGKEPLSNRFW